MEEHGVHLVYTGKSSFVAENNGSQSDHARIRSVGHVPHILILRIHVNKIQADQVCKVTKLEEIEVIAFAWPNHDPYH